MHQQNHLLTTTDEEIESIAIEVGYQNPFTFSTSFKKLADCLPSEHLHLTTNAPYIGLLKVFRLLINHSIAIGE
ncbi:MAG: hypothetical protein ABF328_05430 [Akkermansiaceae bacterium]